LAHEVSGGSGRRSVSCPEGMDLAGGRGGTVVLFGPGAPKV